MTEIKQYPLDFSALEKGTNILQEQIEEIYKVKAGSNEYDLKKLELQNRIEVELALRGLLVTVKSVKNGLRILTDPEAAIHNQKRFNNELKTLARVHSRKAAVDTANLNETEKVIHQRDLHDQGRYMQALNTVRRQIVVETRKSRFALQEKG